MLAQITSLALVDAVNPCTIAVQIMLLSALILTKGKKEVILGGLLFTFTVFLMYALYGIGLLQVIYTIGLESVLRIVLKVLLGIMAFVEIRAFFFYKEGMSSMEMPMKFRPFAKKITASVQNPLMAVPAAALCSILLLPCSSGPYVAALLILSSVELALRIPLLVYYNFLFTLPMTALTLLAAFGTSPQKVMQWKNDHIKTLHLVAGILLMAVLFLM
jgi:hypothetical protein